MNFKLPKNQPQITKTILLTITLTFKIKMRKKNKKIISTLEITQTKMINPRRIILALIILTKISILKIKLKMISNLIKKVASIMPLVTSDLTTNKPTRYNNQVITKHKKMDLAISIIGDPSLIF